LNLPIIHLAELGAEALQRLTEAPLTINQRLLLGDCVQAYLPLDEAQSVEFERILLQSEYEGARAMNKTSFELGHETNMERGIERGLARGMERGMEQGCNQGHRELVIAVLEGRFGPLSEEALSKIDQLSDLRILQLARSIGNAQSLSELGLA
jgi:flagellar biosynthesis/type III secretory pathway protein FliH